MVAIIFQSVISTANFYLGHLEQSVQCTLLYQRLFLFEGTFTSKSALPDSYTMIHCIA